MKRLLISTGFALAFASSVVAEPKLVTCDSPQIEDMKVDPETGSINRETFQSHTTTIDYAFETSSKDNEVRSEKKDGTNVGMARGSAIHSEQGMFNAVFTFKKGVSIFSYFIAPHKMWLVVTTHIQSGKNTGAPFVQTEVYACRPA